MSPEHSPLGAIAPLTSGMTGQRQLPSGFEHILAAAADSLLPKSGQKRPAKLSTERPAQLPLWLTDIASLLRYHDSRERRWQHFATETQKSEALAPAEAERLILGDLLEFALSGDTDSPVDYLIQLQKRSQLSGQVLGKRHPPLVTIRGY